MAKVLTANINITKIGLDDGRILEIETSKLNFIPNEGDLVEVYRSDDEIIINRIEKFKKEERTYFVNNNYDIANYDFGIRVHKL